MSLVVNNNTGDYSQSLPALLEKRIIDSDNKTSFIYKNREYSWRDIDSGSNVIASDLSKLGVKKGSHVGISGTNSINWIFTFFAIQKLGGIAVLINPGLKPNELIKNSKIADVTCVCYSEIPEITTFDSYKEACLNQGSIKSMYNISDSIDFSLRYSEELNKKQHRIKCQSDDACIIIYTSGSTGAPKAVLSSAYSIMYSIKPIIENIGQKESDINLAFLPFFHVFGFITTIIIGLLQGTTSIIPSTKSPSEMIELIDKYKVTLFNTVPTMMLGIVSNKDFTPEKLSSVRSSILGGSITTKEQMIMLRKTLPNIHFGNIYGMSENSAISLTEYDDSFEHITETVGKPLEGNIVLIKDEKGNVVPDGTQGEIVLKSGGMLTWYYKLPINSQPLDEEGFLRTGDLGFKDSNGYIRLTGRLKDLIICGGENISPLEITEALLSLGYFSDVNVVGIPDDIKGEVVGAGVVLKSNYTWDENMVRNEMANILSKYKLPVYYKVFESFPLLNSGKVDKISIAKQIYDEIKEV